MTKYAKVTGVPHQIAFDYRTMLTLDFDTDLVKDRHIPPRSAQVAWLEEESQDGSDYRTHRSYLLGYLYCSLQEELGKHGITLD